MNKYLQSISLILFTCFCNYFAAAQAVKNKKPVPPVVASKPVPKSATKPLPVKEKVSPFSKGTWNFANRTNIDYTHYKELTPATTNDFSIYVNPKYFFIDHFAVGITARASAYKTTSLSSSFSSYYAYLNLTYGTTISNKINVFASVGAGPGHSKSEFTNGNTTTLVSKSFDIYGTVGVPILLEQGNAAYFTPFATYDAYHNKPGTHDVHEKSISFGLKLETYLNAANTKVNTGKTELSKGSYTKGSCMLDINSLSNLSFSKKNEMQGNVKFAPVKTNRFSLGAGAYYYFMDNVAGGLNIDISSTKTDNVASVSKDKSWELQPVIMANVPVETALRNLFIQAGYGFGKSNYSNLKKKISEVSIRAGYNFFITKNISITPKIGYNKYKQVTANGSSVGSISQSKGLATELGIRTWLNFLKKHK